MLSECVFFSSYLFCELNNGEMIFNTITKKDNANPETAKINSSLESTVTVSIADTPHIMISVKESKCFIIKFLRVNAKGLVL